MITSRILKSALCASALILSSSLSHAAIVTVNGTDVSFKYDDATQFGTATIVGNSIFFFNPNFLAQSLNTDGPVIDSDFVNIEIDVLSGSSFTMDNFQLFELGDYELNGSSASVSADAQLSVTSLTGACPFPCTMAPIFSAGPLTTQGALTEWTINGVADLDNNANWGSDTKVNLKIQNNLNASSTEFGDSAFIVKKVGALGVTVSAVPVPAAAWLFGSAMLGLVALKKRKLS